MNVSRLKTTVSLCLILDRGVRGRLKAREIRKAAQAQSARGSCSGCVCLCVLSTTMGKTLKCADPAESQRISGIRNSLFPRQLTASSLDNLNS